MCRSLAESVPVSTEGRKTRRLGRLSRRTRGRAAATRDSPANCLPCVLTKRRPPSSVSKARRLSKALRDNARCRPRPSSGNSSGASRPSAPESSSAGFWSPARLPRRVPVVRARLLAQRGRAEEAAQATKILLTSFPGLTVEKHLKNFRWKVAADTGHYREGLLKAGVPSTQTTAADASSKRT